MSKSIWNRIATAFQPGMEDLFVFGGLGCLWYGISQVHVGAAWAVVGLLMFWLGARK